MSASGMPRIRALVLDARRDPASPTPCVAGLARVARARGDETQGGFGRVLVESGRFEILFEHFERHAPTRTRVHRARGVDVAVVIAGQRNGVASRDLKLLHACGCRRALLLVPPAVPDVVVEHLGRHLLLGARYDADDMPVVQLAHEPEAMSVDDIAAVLDALDRTVAPTPPGDVLAVVESSITIDVLRGELVPGAELFVHEGDALSPHTIAIEHVTAAGDRASGPLRVANGAVIAHERLSFVRGFDLPGVHGSDDVSEMCFAFGGDGGFAEGRILRGRVTLEEPIAPRDGRVGLVRFQGAVLGPVQSIAVDATRTVRAALDAEETPEDARRPAGWTGDAD